jgi:hypothetical protein
MIFLAMSCNAQMNMTTIARLCFVLLLFCAAAMSKPSLAGDLVLKLDQAEFILDDSETPPSESAPWKPQRLPDNWSLSRPQAGGFGWYRIRFELSELPSGLYAVYAPKISVNGAFYVNGQYLGSEFKGARIAFFSKGRMYDPGPLIRSWVGGEIRCSQQEAVEFSEISLSIQIMLPRINRAVRSSHDHY